MSNQALSQNEILYVATLLLGIYTLMIAIKLKKYKVAVYHTFIDITSINTINFISFAESNYLIILMVEILV